jgi:hypothetical protein
MEFKKIIENHGNSDKNTPFVKSVANNEKHGFHVFRPSLMMSSISNLYQNLPLTEPLSEL